MGDRGQRAFDFGRQNLLDLFGIDSPLVAPPRDGFADASRRAKAEVGLDQNVLEIVERIGVEPPLGENVGDAARDGR